MNDFYARLHTLCVPEDGGGGAGGTGGAGGGTGGGAGGAPAGDSSLLGGTGGGAGTAADWRATLPAEIRGEACLATFKAKDTGEALAQIAKGYVHAQRLIGTEKIQKPRDNWTPEQWKGFYKDLGVPETPDKYAVPEVKLADGLTLVPEKIEAYKKIFHDAGLTPRQVDKVMRAYLEDTNADFTGRQTAAQAQLAKAVVDLKAEFGDKYNAKLDIARSVLKKFGSDTLLQKLEASGMANDPEVVKLFARLGEGMLEDRANGNGTGGLDLEESTQALQEINRLKGDSEFQKALGTRTDPGHRAAVDKWMALHTAAAARKDA